MDSNAVSPEEVDYFVQSLRKFEVKDVGAKSWLEFHECLMKLHQQAIIEASSHREEVIKELMILENKIPLLVHEAYCVLVWRYKVLPKTMERAEEINANFFIYTVLYHEAIAVSFLETLLFYEDTCESLGDCALDLIDYCVQGVTHLIGLVQGGYNEKTEDLNKELKNRDELEKQRNDIQFTIGMKCITILSYLSDKISVLSTSAATRLTKTHDVPCLLSELLTIKPWMRRNKGFQKYIEGKWEILAGEEILKVVKVEAQTWFCLRNLMFNRETFENYEINAFRQRELGKCSGLLNEGILDQLPPLGELKHFLCTLQVGGNYSNNLNNLVLEVIPDIKDNIIENAKKIGWKKIIEDHTKLFMMEENEIVEIAKRLNDAYNIDMMVEIEERQRDKTMDDCKRCSNCKKEAVKKCSRCEAVFYCSRECQVKDWPKHKNFCYEIVN